MGEVQVRAENLLRRHLANPFLVLELSTAATAAEVERQGQKLLLMLSAGVAEAESYATPIGRVPRSAEQVREALDELRHPDKRLLHEWWATAWGDE